jgi:hypothetical protein
MARENPRWGYQRITGELDGLGIIVSATTVRKILRQAGLGTAGERSRLSWRACLRAQAASMLVVDFFTVETISLQRRTCSSSSNSEADASTWLDAPRTRPVLWVTQRSPPIRVDTPGAPIVVSLPDPRPRQQVHRRLRRRLRKRRHQDHQDTGASAEGERERRALRSHRPRRVPRLATDREPAPP